MPKNLFQDMVKIKRASQGIQAPAQRETRSTDNTPDSIEEEDLKTFLTKLKETKIGGKKTRHILWGVAIISVIFFIFSISYLFLEASVTVNPKMKDVVLDENLSAVKDGGAETLPFDLVVISGEENKTAQTAEKKDFSQKAEGVVVIYNAFSSASQRLDIDTRLIGSNGKIYKTKKAVIVPGMKGDLPGSIEVGIYASVSGEEYNSGPLDFTILGFKGTPKYAKFYARSKGPIIGGLKGKLPFISDSQKASVENDLKATLQAKLFKSATDQIPNGFILFKNATVLNIDDDSVDSTSSKDNITIKIRGALYGFLFDEEKLTEKIAKDNIAGYDGSPVYLANIRDLNFSLSSKDNISFADVNNINFSLKGAIKIIWKVNERELAADLLGKSKKDFNQILAQYPNIDSANLSISPFWKMSLPDKSKDIKVIVNYPK